MADNEPACRSAEDLATIRVWQWRAIILGMVSAVIVFLCPAVLHIRIGNLSADLWLLVMEQIGFAIAASLIAYKLTRAMRSDSAISFGVAGAIPFVNNLALLFAVLRANKILQKR